MEKEIKDFIWNDLDKLIFFSILENDNVYLSGPTGTGKSSRIKYMNYVYNIHNLNIDPSISTIPFYRVSLRDTIEDSQLLGGLTISLNNGVLCPSYQDGIISIAAKNGGWVLLDEIDAAKPEILFALHSLFEDPRELTLLDNNSEKVSFHPEFRIIVTGNTKGRGDFSGLYQGTRLGNEAFLDRFIFFDIDYPESYKEKTYLTSFCSRDIATKIVNLASLIREAQAKDQINVTFSVRRTKMLAQKISAWGLERSLKYILLSRLDSDEKIQVSELIQRVFDINING